MASMWRSTCGPGRLVTTVRRCALALLTAGVLGEAVGAERAPRSCGGATTAEPIACGDVVTCAFLVLGDTKAYTFAGTSGDAVFIETAALGGSVVEPGWTLVDGSFAQVPGCYATFGGSRRCGLPTSGTYTILVSDYGDNQIGAYGISFHGIAEPGMGRINCALDVGCASLVEDTVLERGDDNAYRFSAASGGAVRINVAALPGSSVEPSWRLFSPSGEDVPGCSAIFGGARNCAALPEDGTYTLVVGEYGADAVGAYAVSVNGTSGGAGPGASTCAVPLPCGGYRHDELALVADESAYRFTASTSDSVYVSTASLDVPNLEPGWQLYAPDGQPVAGCNRTFGGPGNCAGLPQDGTYTLVVGDYGANASGGYGVAVQVTSEHGCCARSITAGEGLTGNVAGVGAVEAFVFAAPAGGGVSISTAALGGAGFEAGWQLYDPEGMAVPGCGRIFGGDGLCTSLPKTGAYIVVVGDYGVDAAGEFNMVVQGAATSAVCVAGSGLSSVIPSRGGNTGRVTVTVRGTSLATATALRLRDELPIVVLAQGLEVLGDGVVRGTFDLTGIPPGPYDVAVETTEGELSLADGFDVVEGGAPLIVLDVIGPGTVRTGREATFTATVRNEGVVDAGPVLVQLRAEQLPAPLGQTAQPVQLPPPLIGLTTALPLLPPGMSGTILIPPITFPSSGCGSVTGTATDMSADPDQCVEDCLAGHAFCISGCAELPPDLFEVWARQCDKDLAECILDTCFSDASAPFTGQRAAADLPVCAINSWDPNEKVGPTGFGVSKFTRRSPMVPYTIYFENLSTATAAARDVLVEDQLDSDFDVSTFALRDIRVGNHILHPPGESQTLATDIDLRPEANMLVRIDASIDTDTGVVTWRFTSIDPATGQPPADPLAGFLPPNAAPPAGEGSVQFVVAPKPNLATGQELRNRARITFDTNPPIDTAEWLNRIDGATPTSQVDAVEGPPCSSGLTVRWSGDDIGAGIRDYTVFVSEDDGPYTVLVGQTPDTAATFNRDLAKSYRIYSVARDGAGNVEPQSGAADMVVTPPAGCCAADDECADTNPCNGMETCDASTNACTPGVAPPCADDGDSCTRDECQPGIGCTHVAIPDCASACSQTCNDGDPCTTDTCLDTACLRADVTGLPSATCVCDRAASAACGGEALPAKLTSKTEKACRSLGAAGDSTTRKQMKKRLKKARAAWRAAARTLAKPSTERKLTAGCRQALQDEVADAATRVERLLGDP